MLKIYDPIYSVSIDGGPWKRLEDPLDTNWFLFRKLMIIFVTIIFPEQEHAGLFSKASPNSRCYISTPATENILKSAKDFGLAQRTDFARM